MNDKINIDSFSIITLFHISVNLKETFPLYMLVNEINIINYISGFQC